jgi:hypothetical protein
VHNFLLKKVLGSIELLRIAMFEPIKKGMAGDESAYMSFYGSNVKVRV